MLDNFFADSTTEMGTNDVFVARLAASNKDLIFERPKSVEQLFKTTSKNYMEIWLPGSKI